MRSAAQTLVAVVALLMAALVAGCEATVNALEASESAPSIETDEPRLASGVDSANALAQLGNIPVRGRAPKTGYTRDEFGPAWADIDRNGCDTRNDILARDLTGATFKAGTNNCVV
ncbi:hypothetical protein, partial [Escherichia coli]|uniref:hypothetical protein n=1 Tax=Escherichia coli TaxID=562 RepID=UPI0032E3EFE9